MRYRANTVRAALALLCLCAAPFGVAQTSDPVLPQARVDTTYARSTGASIAVKTGDNLQKALDSAQPGDEIVLEAGATFTGNFILPNKISGAGWITIRSSRMSSLPAGRRVRPSDAAAMPKIVTPNSGAALSTRPGSHHYRIMGLEMAVAPGVGLNYVTVFLGDGATLEELPADIILDRVYIHGTALCTCKQGIILSSRRTAVIDSYISEYHAIGMDTQAILSFNSPGPFEISNNYLEGAGENIMFGGANASVPGVVPSDIAFKRNYLAKPVRWRDSIIPAPRLTASPSSDGALGPDRTYYYTAVALGPGGGVPELQSDAATEVAVPLSGSLNSVALTWAPVRYGEGADVRAVTSYRIYRTTDPPTAKPRTWVYFTVPGAGPLSLRDTGSAGQSGSPGQGNRWVVKNLFEIKNAQRVLVDGNVMEYNWQHGQLGFAILVQPRGENGRMPWAVAEDLTFTNNLIRHSGAGLALGGIDDACLNAKPATPCRQSSRVLFRNNLFEDVSYKNWGGRGWAFQVYRTDGAVIDRNTAINEGTYGFSMWVDGPNTRLVVTNNIVNGNLAGGGAVGSSEIVAKHAADGNISHNVVAAGDPKLYDASSQNFLPASLRAVGFNNYTAGDFSLAAESPYKGVALGGGDPGANVEAVRKATAGVVTGTRVTGQTPAIASVLNAASLASDGVAPGSLVSIYGVNLGEIPARAFSDPLPHDLGDVVVTVNGVPAPLLSVDAGQIDAQVPFETVPGPATAVVTAAGVSSAVFSFKVVPAAPGLFLSERDHAAAFNEDQTPNTADNPAPAGTLLTAYLTGQGAVEPAIDTGSWTPAETPIYALLPVSASVGGRSSRVVWASLTPGCAGVFQVSVVLPEMEPGDYPLVITVGQAASNAGVISIGASNMAGVNDAAA